MKLSLLLIIFLITPNLHAEILVNIENFEQFKSMTVNSSQKIAHNKKMKPRSQRDSSPYVFPPYVYSKNAQSMSTWKSDGYTVLKTDISNEEESFKIETIQKDLKDYLGDDFDTKMSALKEVYDLIDIRYYTVNSSDQANEACISVRWIRKAWLQNGTVNFCGYHYADESDLSFEVREWSNNDKSLIADYLFKEEDAWPLLEIALASFSIVYSIPENQQALLEAINNARNTP